MQRIQIAERHNWQAIAEGIGFQFHTFGNDLVQSQDAVMHYQPAQGLAGRADFVKSQNMVKAHLDSLQAESQGQGNALPWEDTRRHLWVQNFGTAVQPPQNPVREFLPEKYWDESVVWQFTLDQVERDIEDPTNDLHQHIMALCDKVCRSEELMTRLHIPKQYQSLVYTSWVEGHPHLYGRMDFAYTGNGPAKLLELNYDTPTSLFEASVVQWQWMTDMRSRFQLPGDVDQFNSIHEKLLSRFRLFRDKYGITLPFYFAAMGYSKEDCGTVDYLRDVATQAGYDARFVAIEEIGCNDMGKFIDMDDNPISYLFKLHAWEHIFQEGFGPKVEKSSTLFIEPAWKSVLSNKGILPLLWEEYEGHPNLLPAFIDKDPSASLGAGFVRKPYFSREGANVDVVTPGGEKESVPGPYTDAPYIIQQYAPLMRHGKSHSLIGSWVVGDEACGMGIREDDSLVTKDSSRFQPHVILG
ncbi:glutathionylspermidine synthase [Pseudomonas nitritireducens]|uniref:Glutathionylspermidine synthase n=1 Tax=Pseudomonas nitroreducens TaxID=46680 RepID=A0A7W7P3M6_PSENT|nr:glutathionylspermidine synthase family protein [Pseudomonas nitritireducens]MBB4866811.1 glutathionylspermidine synthase [Pseudomonas nitritireducens]